MLSFTDLNIKENKIKQFERRGINTPSDLAMFLPKRYLDFSVPTGIPDGSASDGAECTFTGTVEQVSISYRNMSVVSATVKLSSYKFVKVKWFQQQYMYERIKALKGHTVFVGGKVKYVDWCNPCYEVSSPSIFEPLENKRDIYPVYPAISGMADSFREKVLLSALRHPEIVTDPLPEGMAQRYGFMPQYYSVVRSHFPRTVAEAELARRRLTFNDLCLFSAANYYARKKAAVGSPFNPYDLSLYKKIKEGLPYELTKDQKACVEGIIDSATKGRRVQALIQGDVGCGKSICAFLIACCFARSGMQTCIMAPTQALAMQHYIELKELLLGQGIEIAFLGAGMKSKDKQAALDIIEDGTAKIVVGTHACISPNVRYKKLACCIIDEEHKFGVAQRATLCEKGSLGIHMITMSATPIPRSLADIVYGFGTDVYSIRTMPKGRMPVATSIAKDRDEIFALLKKEIAAGHQAYVVCPMIEEGDSDIPSVESISDIYAKALPDVSVETLTGKDTKAKAEEVLSAFRGGKLDLLVATSVIEVGISIKNATVIIIEGADRFGLSSLHQLRGRVGRSDLASYCLLYTEHLKEKALQRLCVLTSTNDGFKVAEEDLAQRGAGDFFGERQSGDNKFLNMMFEFPDVYKKAQKAAVEIVDGALACDVYDWLMREDWEIAESEEQ